MKPIPYELSQINSRVTHDPQAFIAECEDVFAQQILSVGEQISTKGSGNLIVALAGPSSAGKTTTANMLAGFFRTHRTGACVLSLDNFFRQPDQAPLLPNGERDYESPDALDLEGLEACLLALLREGSCEIPLFTFGGEDCGKKTKRLWVNQDDVIIIEGLHALNPTVTAHLPKDRLSRVYISVHHGIEREGELFLSPREIRLLRRLARDAKHRNSSASNTLKMWPQVVAGEDQYLAPYKPLSEIQLYSLHGYEVGMIKAQVLELLANVPPGDPHVAVAAILMQKLQAFCLLGMDLLPKRSLLREFM